ncbi:hypothetical protein ACFQ2B_15055 [Streptomyces stramineus]
MRYWARYVDEEDWRAGEGPTTVVRRRMSPERIYDEAFKRDNTWGPTASVYAFFDARPSNPRTLSRSMSRRPSARCTASAE